VLTIQIVPGSGVKINRYPRVRVEIPAQLGLVLAAEAQVGNSAPPPPDQLETNYFKTVDPVKLKLRIDKAASKGGHEVQAKLTYFYCVASSGYCAPEKVDMKVPVTVR